MDGKANNTGNITSVTLAGFDAVNSLMSVRASNYETAQLNSLSNTFKDISNKYAQLNSLQAQNDFEFQYQTEFAALANTTDPSAQFKQKMTEHLNKIINTYPGLDERTIIKMNGAIDTGSVQIIPKAKQVSETNIFKDAKRNYERYALSGMQIPEEITEKAIDDISNVVKSSTNNPEILASNDIYAENAKQIAKDRAQAAKTGYSGKSNFKLDILPFAPGDLGKSTEVSSDMRMLQTKNPLLARAFLMIKGKSDDEVNGLIQQVRKIAPGSPDLYNLNIAFGIRRGEVAKDAITYGENQNYFLPDNIRADHNSTFNDLGPRFDNSSYMYKTFGTTNILKKEEKLLLKEMDPTLKAIFFQKSMVALEYYNNTNPNNKIPMDFLAKDLNEVDGDLYKYVSLSRHFPQIELFNYPIIQNILANDKAVPSSSGTKLIDLAKSDTTVNRLVSSMDGGHDMLRILFADAQFRGESTPKFNDFFDYNDSYFFPKQAQNGPSYQDAARKLTYSAVGPDDKGPVILRNVDVDTYLVTRKDGSPVLKNGNLLLYTARELEDYLVKNATPVRKIPPLPGANIPGGPDQTDLPPEA